MARQNEQMQRAQISKALKATPVTPSLRGNIDKIMFRSLPSFEYTKTSIR